MDVIKVRDLLVPAEACRDIKGALPACPRVASRSGVFPPNEQEVPGVPCDCGFFVKLQKRDSRLSKDDRLSASCLLLFQALRTSPPPASRTSVDLPRRRW